MAEDKYNLKNTAVKRILQEVKEMQSNPSDDFMSLPLEENIFEWQFAIRGPCDTEFEAQKSAHREVKAHANSVDAEVVAAGEVLPAPAGDRIIEEVQEEVPTNINPSAAAVGASRAVPANGSRFQLQPKPESRVRKPADDRLYTWAAVGLTIAIFVLLLKKFMKSNGHGAVFMNGS